MTPSDILDTIIAEAEADVHWEVTRPSRQFLDLLKSYKELRDAPDETIMKIQGLHRQIDDLPYFLSKIAVAMSSSDQLLTELWKE